MNKTTLFDTIKAYRALLPGVAPAQAGGLVTQRALWLLGDIERTWLDTHYADAVRRLGVVQALLVQAGLLTWDQVDRRPDPPARLPRPAGLRGQVCDVWQNFDVGPACLALLRPPGHMKLFGMYRRMWVPELAMVVGTSIDIPEFDPYDTLPARRINWTSVVATVDFGYADYSFMLALDTIHIDPEVVPLAAVRMFVDLALAGGWTISEEAREGLEANYARLKQELKNDWYPEGQEEYVSEDEDDDDDDGE